MANVGGRSMHERRDAERVARRGEDVRPQRLEEACAGLALALVSLASGRPGFPDHRDSSNQRGEHGDCGRG
jgi:hypothetical protein